MAYADENQGVILDRYVNTPRPEECVAASRQYFEALTWVTDIEVITRCLQKSLETALEDSPLRDVLMTQIVQNISRAFKAADMTQEDIDAWRGQPWELLITNKDISWPVDLLGCPGYAERMTSLLGGYFTRKDS